MQPITKRVEGGEYSTVILGTMIETVFFPDDDSPERIVGRTSIYNIASDHIKGDST